MDSTTTSKRTTPARAAARQVTKALTLVERAVTLLRADRTFDDVYSARSAVKSCAGELRNLTIQYESNARQSERS